QLERIRAMGVSLALDDVGTGFSSMCQIKTLPLDCLKIDRTFVQDLPDCLTSQCIVRALLDLADGLGLEVVAEGVETTAQFEYLHDVGCRAFQGYLFGRPAPWHVSKVVTPLLLYTAVSALHRGGVPRGTISHLPRES